MKLCSELMQAIRSRVLVARLTQNQAAKLFGVTQPPVSDLLRGKINLFGSDIGQHGDRSRNAR